MKDKKFLRFIYDRLENVHGESAKVDYMRKFKTIIETMPEESEEQKYGCHCDLEDGDTPDECVIDRCDYEDCIFANRGIKKEQCEYWRIIE